MYGNIWKLSYCLLAARRLSPRHLSRPPKLGKEKYNSKKWHTTWSGGCTGGGARVFDGEACLCACIWCLTQNRVFLSIHVPIWSFTAAFEKTAKQNLWWFSIEKLSFPLGVLNALVATTNETNSNGYKTGVEWSALFLVATIQLESFKINRIYRTTLNNSMGLSSKSMFALLFGLRFYVSLLSDREGAPCF